MLHTELKRLGRVILRILMLIAFTALSYASGAFIAADWNIVTWNPFYKTLLVAVWAGFLVTLIVYWAGQDRALRQ